jgi:chaperonin GroES
MTTKTTTLCPTPLARRILVVHEDAAETTTGGIVIPDSAKEKPQTAKVIAVGPDAKDIHVGEIVIYSSFAGVPLQLDGREIVIVDEEDVLVRFEEVEAPDDND